jgi:hypothetical protein
MKVKKTSASNPTTEVPTTGLTSATCEAAADFLGFCDAAGETAPELDTEVEVEPEGEVEVEAEAELEAEPEAEMVGTRLDMEARAANEGV